MAFDLQTFLVTAASSLGLSLGGVYLLSEKLLEHRLTERLETHKASLQKDLAKEKAEIEGAVKREVETQLGDRAAQRQYEYDARKRLYTAIGPLRFQLLLACRDCAGRIGAHGQHEASYEFDLAAYYGQSTLYRLLRPLAITELIEREIAYSDFSVDGKALDCLRFKKAAQRALSGDLVSGHPQLDWTQQAQHVFVDSLSTCALALVDESGDRPRVLRFNEFRAGVAKSGGLAAFDPFPQLFTGFSVRSKTILWTRLVAYAHLCARFVETAGTDVGFDPVTVPVRDLVMATSDRWLAEHIQETMRGIEALPAIRL